jgi:hypothetical protein
MALTVGTPIFSDALSKFPISFTLNYLPISSALSLAEESAGSSTGSEDSRERNCACAGFGTVTGSRSSAVAPAGNS